MARKADEKQLQVVIQLIEKQPGNKSSEYASLMGCHRQTFNRFLVQLNDRGMLLSEDGQGRLWLFDENRKI